MYTSISWRSLSMSPSTLAASHIIGRVLLAFVCSLSEEDSSVGAPRTVVLFHATGVLVQHEWVWGCVLDLLLAIHTFICFATYPGLLVISKHPEWCSSACWSVIFFQPPLSHQFLNDVFSNFSPALMNLKSVDPSPLVSKSP
jgi:hypothetical protein